MIVPGITAGLAGAEPDMSAGVRLGSWLSPFQHRTVIGFDVSFLMSHGDHLAIASNSNAKEPMVLLDRLYKGAIFDTPDIRLVPI